MPLTPHPDALRILRVGLIEDPFDWQTTKDGRIRVFRGGRLVTTVAGRQADRLRPQLDAGGDAAQQALARVTGNYKRGNERGSSDR
jgi:hypothetical protein